jgi:hypothetical protein
LRTGAEVLAALALLAFGYAPALAAGPLEALAARLGGSWTVSDHDEPSIEVPGGGDGHGLEVWRSSKGMPLTEELHLTFGTTELRFYAVLFWDRGAQQLRGLGCGEFLPSGCIPFNAVWSKNALTINSEYDVEGAHYASVETFAFQDNDHFTQVIYVSKDGGAARLTSTLKAVRCHSEGTRCTP